MIKKAIAAAGIALLAVFAAPLSASAAGYVPEESIAVTDSTPAPGQAVSVNFAAGAFANAESVQFTVDGQGSATLASVRTAVVQITKTASATGSVAVSVTVPSNASGTYTVTATGLTSGNVGTAALTVAPADAGAGVGLPVTGGTIPFAVIWIAAGAVALGVALVVVLSIRRRANA